ncbi:Helix-turn-helix domain-containing protein [Streptomyces sp. DvalAA-14]|uniref:helix-turn-helix domain-containing protein n=1 Tax=unclassified Streptomyces TaxID=2593676 RepID=UPI00081AFDE6|nr:MULTISPECIES: helix-turn-helix transcriptional regulator [unclassified Streptomyces]MYS22513.1 helix-turn-helix domain-containing protein [Streptomyces sp. SID4948]SCE17506.1 Helix-turn-helix domain-containing protein [Streptomyces sp. DvalAA-14]
MAPRRRRLPRKKNPTPFESLGAQLARARIARGFTQVQLAEAAIISLAKLESIEQDRRPLTLDLARQFDEVLGTNGLLEVGVEHLPDADSVIPVWALAFVDLERDAIAISSFENQVLPGLLQTEEYMRAVFDSRVPILDPDEIALQIAVRLERQEILQRRVPPVVSFVLSEATVRDRLGGDEVYRGQLRHLRACADVPGIAIQILPLGLTGHAGLSGPFVLVETPEHEHLAYAETQRGSHFVHDPDEVSILAARYAMLRTQAHNTYETKGLLDQLVGE